MKRGANKEAPTRRRISGERGISVAKNHPELSEAEVTPEMMAAGERALSDWVFLPVGKADPGDGVLTIWRAMHEAKRCGLQKVSLASRPSEQTALVRQ
jgi:hypothetical protein